MGLDPAQGARTETPQLSLHNLLYMDLAQHPHQELPAIRTELVRCFSTGWGVGSAYAPGKRAHFLPLPRSLSWAQYFHVWGNL